MDHNMTARWIAKGTRDYANNIEIKDCPYKVREAIEAWRIGWLDAYDHDADGKQH